MTQPIEITWPNQRRVSLDQIKRWASDDLYNEESRSVLDWRELPAEYALAIVHHHGHITLANTHGYNLPEYSSGDAIPGVTFE